MSDDENAPALLQVGMTDLPALADALDDNNPDTTWWFHTSTGDVRPEGDWSAGFDSDDLEYQGWVIVSPGRTRAAFEDMSLFAEAVGDIRAREMLVHSLEGKGAFRRFRDTLRSYPDLREPWLTWSDVRSEARAIRWLIDNGHVDEVDAEEVLLERRAEAQAALDEAGGRHGSSYPLAEAPAYWPEIVEALDRGETVNLTRDGAVHALITIYESPI